MTKNIHLYFVLGLILLQMNCFNSNNTILRYTINDVIGCWELFRGDVHLRSGSAATTTRYYLERDGRYKVYSATYVNIPGVDSRLVENTSTGSFTLSGSTINARPDIGNPFSFNFSIVGGAVVIGGQKYMKC